MCFAQDSHRPDSLLEGDEAKAYYDMGVQLLLKDPISSDKYLYDACTIYEKKGKYKEEVDCLLLGASLRINLNRKKDALKIYKKSR